MDSPHPHTPALNSWGVSSISKSSGLLLHITSQHISLTMGRVTGRIDFEFVALTVMHCGGNSALQRKHTQIKDSSLHETITLYITSYSSFRWTTLLFYVLVYVFRDPSFCFSLRTSPPCMFFMLKPSLPFLPFLFFFFLQQHFLMMQKQQVRMRRAATTAMAIRAQGGTVAYMRVREYRRKNMN